MFFERDAGLFFECEVELLFECDVALGLWRLLDGVPAAFVGLVGFVDLAGLFEDSDDEFSTDFNNVVNSFSVKSRHSPTGRPFNPTCIIRTRLSFSTS